jgi:hypothetical protein
MVIDVFRHAESKNATNIFIRRKIAELRLENEPILECLTSCNDASASARQKEIVLNDHLEQR